MCARVETARTHALAHLEDVSRGFLGGKSMKILSTLAVAIAITAIATPALAGNFSRAEVAWGRAAQACMDRQVQYLKGCRVVVDRKGRLTMWCPAGMDQHFSLRKACDAEAESAAGPPRWKPN